MPFVVELTNAANKLVAEDRCVVAQNSRRRNDERFVFNGGKGVVDRDGRYHHIIKLHRVRREIGRQIRQTPPPGYDTGSASATLTTRLPSKYTATRPG